MVVFDPVRVDDWLEIFFFHGTNPMGKYLGRIGDLQRNGTFFISSEPYAFSVIQASTDFSIAYYGSYIVLNQKGSFHLIPETAKEFTDFNQFAKVIYFKDMRDFVGSSEWNVGFFY